MVFWKLSIGKGGPHRRQSAFERRRNYYFVENASLQSRTDWHNWLQSGFPSFDASPDTPLWESTQPLRVGTQALGCHLRQTRAQQTPEFELRKGLLLNQHAVLFYHSPLPDYPFLLQMHYFQERLMYVQYRFQRNDAQLGHQLFSALREKYRLPMTLQPPDEVMIRDQEGHLARWSYRVVPVLEYGCRSPQWRERVAHALASARPPQQALLETGQNSPGLSAWV
jgi:hypothetical protein